MKRFPKTAKGLESFVRKIVQEELDERADEDTGVIHVMTPEEMKTAKRIEEYNKIYGEEV